MSKIPIYDSFITLGQFLKLTDCISSGGQAKQFLAETKIKVNGIDENRRGKKLIPSDKIYIENIGEFEIIKK